MEYQKRFSLQFFGGFLFLIAAIAYSYFSSLSKARTEIPNAVVSKQEWILTVTPSKSIISDSRGRIIGSISIDSSGNVILTVTDKK